MQPQNIETHATADRRILGFLKRRASKAPSKVWFRFSAQEFADFSGLSLRAVRYALDSLRSDPERHGWHWRTVFDRSIGKRGAWTVLAAPVARLKWDHEPLMRDSSGRSRHVRPHQRRANVEKKVYAPRAQCEEKVYAPRAQCEVRRMPEVSAIPIEGGDIEYLSSQHNTPRRRGQKRCVAWADGKAAAIARRLSLLHWDNCRVRWDFLAVRGFLRKILPDGHEETAITAAYDKALHRAHGFAVDLEVPQFTVASTLAETRRILGRDKRTPDERMRDFYAARAAVAAEIRATFPR